MLKPAILIFCSLLFLLPLVAQKIGFPELQKIKTLDKKKQEIYLLSKHYEKGEIKSDGDNEAVLFKNMAVQDSKIVIRNVTLFTSKQLKMTMLEYTTYDPEEAAALISWLSSHGYRKTTSIVNGKEMSFFRSNNSSTRFFADKGKLSDGSDFNSGTFVLEY